MHKSKIYKWLLMLVIIFLTCICISAITIFRQYIGVDGQAGTVTIAVMQDDFVQNFNTNYFKEWLENKTGYKIRFEYMQPGYEKEYINAMLTSKHNNIDAVFFRKEKEPITKEEFHNYTRAGLIKELSNYMKADDSLSVILKDYNLQSVIEQEYGGIYYMPNMDTSRRKQNYQILWMNIGWLKTLKLEVPDTSDEVYEVLKAFRDKDPNGNGLRDELPLVSCEDDYRLQSYQYLLNAFVYNDPMQLRFFEDINGKIHFAPGEDAFREGLTYCSLLYKEKLLSDVSFSYHKNQLMELVNDPEDLVGAFASQSIEDIVYANSSDVIARYVYLPPLKGPDGTTNAILMDYEPKIGGWIPTNSKEPEKAYKIMETMLSEEASLISEYGEEAVDWEYSDSSDLSVYGDIAMITTQNYLKDNVQNKNFAGAGPQVVSERYIDGVTWKGDNSLVEYIDVRAVKRYELSYTTSKNDLRGLLPGKETGDWSKIASYTDRMLSQFITGESDITSDEQWSKFQQGYKDISVNWGNQEVISDLFQQLNN